jgi:cell division protein FtsN
MKRQQRGGTIIGFILGVLVGLGLALAVAIYVTKVPIPFVNKNQAATPEQDAAEARKNRNWDPNAPLGGKNPARPPQVLPGMQPPPAVTPSTPGTAAATPGTNTPASPQAPAVAGGPGNAPAPAAKSASGDPLGDLAKAKAGAATADPFLYFVQAGAFRTADDAESQRAKLSLMGVEAKVTEREQSGRTVFRVRTGPFERKEDADRMKERLEVAGNEAAIVRVQR